jgi:glycosyltransferase involved in cell wall biosynthesis
MKTMKPSSSLIISTYNWPEALDLVLQSVVLQKVHPNEVLIADDGSGEETKMLIASYQSKFPVPLIHVWIPDDGFRKTKVLNMAYAKAKYSYFVQVDGDCILHPNFISDHLNFAKQGTYVQGSRLYMSAEKSSEIMATKNTKIAWWSGDMINAESGIRNVFLRKIAGIKEAPMRKVRGCNMAFWKDDFIKINGYNEAMTGWGSEDWELAQRLRNLGLKARKLKFGAVQFHIYHIELSRERSKINAGISDATKANKIIRCEKGLDQYLGEHI